MRLLILIIGFLVPQVTRGQPPAFVVYLLNGLQQIPNLILRDQVLDTNVLGPVEGNHVKLNQEPVVPYSVSRGSPWEDPFPAGLGTAEQNRMATSLQKPKIIPSRTIPDLSQPAISDDTLLGSILKQIHSPQRPTPPPTPPSDPFLPEIDGYLSYPEVPDADFQEIQEFDGDFGKENEIAPYIERPPEIPEFKPDHEFGPELFKRINGPLPEGLVPEKLMDVDEKLSGKFISAIESNQYPFQKRVENTQIQSIQSSTQKPMANPELPRKLPRRPSNRVLKLYRVQYNQSQGAARRVLPTTTASPKTRLPFGARITSVSFTRRKLITTTKAPRLTENRALSLPRFSKKRIRTWNERRRPHGNRESESDLHFDQPEHHFENTVIDAETSDIGTDHEQTARGPRLTNSWRVRSVERAFKEAANRRRARNYLNNVRRMSYKNFG